MSSQQLDEEAIFHVARGLSEPALRDKYLDQICAGDQALRDRVEALLEVHENEQAFLKSDPDAAPTVDHSPLAEHPGTNIGRYKLMEQIGEGGMGTVFVAEQERPIRRKVALKVIKPGMDSKAVVARFEAERQALALMDHPNIAKVLDAGTTDSGRPYFAMELVKGISITEYCDKNKLKIRERLDLFIQVCQAIQHAHQKGIIHRDIKPSNVLVTLHDGKPVPKVIDFGVAKALNARLTDKTVYTEHLQVIGTLLYMSPEQAELSGLDIDTRSDVYSLGVLLYELLTGTTPFQQDELDKAGLDEQRRIIRETEPPRASVRISSLGETATAVAAHRQTDPQKLNQLIRGDLDWIVLKAMEKDRSRRYDTAVQLSQDIERHLNTEPVLARPPSTPYRLWKHARRHKTAVVAAMTVVACLLVGVAATTTYAVRLARVTREQAALVAEQAELVQRQDKLLGKYREELTEKALTAAFSGDVTRTRQIAEELRDVDNSESQTSMLTGIAEFYAGNADAAAECLRDARLKDNKNAAAIALLGVLEGYQGNFIEADRLRRVAIKLQPRQRYRDFDELFLAYAMMYVDVDESVRRLRTLVKRRPFSPIVHAHLAAALAEQASYIHDPTAARAAVDGSLTEAWKHLAIAKQTSADNYLIKMIDLWVHFSTMLVSRIGDVRVPEQLRVDADQLARRMLEHDSWPLGMGLAAWYYEFHNAPEKREAYQRLAHSNGPKMWLACQLFADGTPDWTGLFGSVENLRPEDKITLAILAPHEMQNRLSDDQPWNSVFDELRDTRYAIDALQVPLALGEHKICSKMAAELVGEKSRDYFDQTIETSFGAARLLYLAGQRDDEWLLAKAGGNPNTLLQAHFQVAMKCLAHDDVLGARVHLAAARGLFAPWLLEHHWVRALEARLGSDQRPVPPDQ